MDALQENFLDNILPGNYWLTKSMEFVKIESSGTLWYLKRWIVFYHYIFLKKELFDSDYLEIKKIFDNFIESLPAVIQENAKKFFHSVDILGPEFIRLSNFINSESQSFSTLEDKRIYVAKAKRYYFMYLMDSGGQAGWKEKIKNKIVEGKSYSVIVLEISQEMSTSGMTRLKIEGQLSDFPAAIRNERQIFFYYGFFHGKNASDLSGFYNLTNIGKAILSSNFHEILLIWEHQKLIMVSQSPIADIQNINRVDGLKYEKFSVLDHPYVTLLEAILLRKTITVPEYQYIISKISNNNNYPIDKIDNEFIQHAITKTNGFGRSAEVSDNDFLKELKKFILGICELPKDLDSNYFTFVSWVNRNQIDLIDELKGKFLTQNYKYICQYLDNQNHELYQKFESKLRQKYQSLVNNQEYFLDDETRYEWNKYIINFNKNILVTLVYSAISIQEKVYDYLLSLDKIELYYSSYTNILKLFGIKKGEFKALMMDVQLSLKNEGILEIDDYDDYSRIDFDSRDLEKHITEEKLKDLSSGSINLNVNFNLERKRNLSLIKGLRNHYYKEFSDSNTSLIRCDCCKDVTFLTENNLPYIEFHHLIPFSTDFGPDHYLNLFGICPSCHRKMHHMNRLLKGELYRELSQNNNPNKSILDRINELFIIDAISPIHLEFLKKEGILDEQTYDDFLNRNVLI